jgi:anaerobic magnesium-protoporphyrin IX monomethyl ester cyclase
MNVALVQLPHFYGQGQSRPPENYPLGLGYLSAVLAQHGVAHEGVDLWAPGLTVEAALKSIDFSRFDVIGVSAYSTQYSYLKPFTLGLRERYPDIPIVCGGAGATFSAETILTHTGVDVCVISEGEATFPELLERLDEPSAVAGIAYREDGEVKRTEPRAAIRDLDALPLPDRELFDFEAVIATANAVRASTDMPELKQHPRRAADIIAGRGCPYECTFCSRTFSGCRLRSVDGLMAEIEMLRERYRIDHLSFNDELVVVNRKRILALCERLKGLGITWTCQGRINHVDREILTAMKEAGCIEIGYGVESISQSILDAMNKRMNAEDVVPVIELTREIGIKPLIQYMYGFPGETDETIEATIRFFDRIDHPFVGFTTTPIPGSPLYAEVRARGLIGDEEKYLLRLDSGYNLAGGMVNLTGFSDEEFMARKRKLQIAVTHNYLKRRPVQYARYLGHLAATRLRRLAGHMRPGLGR